MTKKLIIPPSTSVSDAYRNLNGSGGSLQLVLSIAILSIFSIGVWVLPFSGDNTTKYALRILFPAISFYSAWRLFNLTIVDVNSSSLRIKVRGKQYIIPYSDIVSVSESGGSTGGVIGVTSSRTISVRLNQTYPFGTSFVFYTKKEYTITDGLSGPARMIQNYAAQAQND
jgi:hypothetical protein